MIKAKVTTADFENVKKQYLPDNHSIAAIEEIPVDLNQLGSDW